MELIYMNTTPNLFIYSTRSEPCMRLLNIMQQNNIVNMFRLVCLDDMAKIKQNQFLTNIISKCKEVPIMIFQGNIYESNAAWQQASRLIEYIKMQHQETMKQNIMFAQMAQLRAEQEKQKQGPLGFSHEMSGMSDSFAYTQTDVPQPKEFCQYGQDDKSNIMTPVVDIRKEKMSRNEQEKYARQIEESRKTQDTELQQYIKIEQAKAVLQSENK